MLATPRSDGEHPRRHQPQVGHRDRDATSATRSSERDVARAELTLADEVFLVGTAAELTPVREIDDIEIGPPGAITREIQTIFDDALHGRVERYSDWLDVVPVPSKA